MMTTEAQKLPNGWQWVEIKDVADIIVPTRDKPKRFCGDIPWITLPDLDDFFVISAKNLLTHEDAAEVGNRLMPPNTVLLSCAGSLGKVAVTTREVYANQQFYGLVAKANLIDPIFLAFSLKMLGEDFFFQLAGISTVGFFSKDKALGIKIVLPPLAEQKRIAAIAQKADRLRRTRHYALQLSDTYLRSVFLEMFGSPVTNPKGWEIANLGSLSKVETGGTPSRADDSFYSGTIPWVKTSEVVGNIIYQTEEHLTEEGLKSSNCRLFPIGTILIAMYGQGLTRGRSAKLGIKATTNQACAAILPSSKISTDYLWSFLRISYDNLRDLGRGGNQPNLNLELVRSFNVPIPPLPLQEKFAQIVQKFERLRTQQQEAERQAEHLFQTLLHRAFRGELTSQNADDEPESVLLEEIRAQQAKAKAKAKTATQPMGEAADYLGTKAKQPDIEPIQLKFPGFE